MKISKEQFDATINEIKKDAAMLERLYQKGVPAETLIESTNMPPEIISILTNIPVPQKEYIIPVQVITEGYVKVKASSLQDAIAATHNDVETIKLDVKKLSTSLSDNDSPMVRIVDDENIVSLYSDAADSMKFDYLEHDITSLSDLLAGLDADNALSMLLTGECSGDCEECAACQADEDETACDGEECDGNCKECDNNPMGFLDFLGSIVSPIIQGENEKQDNNENEKEEEPPADDDTEKYDGEIEYFEGEDEE